MKVLRARTVLEVTTNADGEVVIAVVVESMLGRETRSVVIQPHDVPVLIEMLRPYGDDQDPDPEDSTTARNLRPIV